MGISKKLKKTFFLHYLHFLDMYVITGWKDNSEFSACLSLAFIKHNALKTETLTIFVKASSICI